MKTGTLQGTGTHLFPVPLNSAEASYLGDVSAEPFSPRQPRLASEAYCGHGSLVGYRPDDSTVVIIPVPCKSWNCPHCGPRKRAYYIDLLSRGDPQREMTLTCPVGLFTSPQSTAVDMKEAFVKLVKQIRKIFKKFEYALVWELTQKGVPHAHVLFRGTYIPQKWLSIKWQSLGFGRVVDIRSVRKGEARAAHACKYLGKATGQTAYELAPLHIVQISQNYVLRPTDDPAVSQVTSYEWSFTPLDPGEVAEIYCRSQNFAHIQQRPAGGYDICLIPNAPDDPLNCVHSPAFSLQLERTPWRLSRPWLLSEEFQNVSAERTHSHL